MATAVSSLFGESDAFKLKQELQQREQEVIGLREMALQRLEAQVGCITRMSLLLSLTHCNANSLRPRAKN